MVLRFILVVLRRLLSRMREARSTANCLPPGCLQNPTSQNVSLSISQPEHS